MTAKVNVSIWSELSAFHTNLSLKKLFPKCSRDKKVFTLNTSTFRTIRIHLFN